MLYSVIVINLTTLLNMNKKCFREKIVKVESGKLVRKLLPYLNKNKNVGGVEVVERRRGQFLISCEGIACRPMEFESKLNNSH